MAQAHAQDRDFAASLGDEIETDPSLVRRAGTRRQHDRVRFERNGFRRRQLVISADIASHPQFADVMDEIVGEAVIVIDEEEHVWVTAGFLGALAKW